MDEARFPRDKVCGRGRVAGGLAPPWPAWDAEEAVRALRPRPVHGMKLTAPDGTGVHGRIRGARAPGFAVRRWCLDRALLRLRAGRGRGRCARACAHATWSPADGIVRGVMVEARGRPERLEARPVVVAADGRRSVIARKLGSSASTGRCASSRCAATGRASRG